jgi:Arc/MetJ-type ribon-helix-helix transcriptional regulator
MPIYLPHELEISLRAAVDSGRFASVNEAMKEATRLLLRELRLDQPPLPPTDDSHADSVLGCMREDADLMDEIVADAYRHRRDETWRDLDL